MNDWFTAHKDGLRQVAERLVSRRGFGIIGGELYQNVADTNADLCCFTASPVENRPQVRLMVRDNNPKGFTDLTHAWTLFAPSEKKGDPTKAGRFNVGEKMVLSFCREAWIETTTGAVFFSDEGRKEFPRRKIDEGTLFTGLIDCTRERYDQLIAYMNRIIVRPNLKLIVNDTLIVRREPIHTFEVTLPTEVGDDLRPSVRKTIVEVHEPLAGETPMLYELGVPVVETDDKWDINIMQKVPLNVDRDNVTPAFLRKVRVAVVNEMFIHLNQEDTTATWVKEATEDKDITGQAMKTVLDKQFGEKRVALDPNNPDANGAALTSGFSIVPARGISPAQRENAKRFQLLPSSSAVFPNEGKGAYSSDPDAKPVDVVDESNWTEGMRLMHGYSVALGMKLLEDKITVRYVNCKSFVGNAWVACFGHRQLDFNIWKLGKAWFNQGLTTRVHSLLIHEFAHHLASNHATDEFHDACCLIGAKLGQAVIDDPAFFRNWNTRFGKLQQGTPVTEESDAKPL